MEEKVSVVDFDTWFEEMAALAQSNPQAFEERRREMIEEAISQADEVYQERLRRLQWRIDMERRRCKTALASCLRLYEMLWDFVYAEGGFLEAVNALKRLAENLQAGRTVTLDEIALNSPKKEESKGKVIPFKRPAS